MAKKIEVFQSEYDYLTQFHKEATLEMTQLRAELDALKRENEQLQKLRLQRQQLGKERRCT